MMVIFHTTKGSDSEQKIKALTYTVLLFDFRSMVLTLKSRPYHKSKWNTERIISSFIKIKDKRSRYWLIVLIIILSLTIAGYMNRERLQRAAIRFIIYHEQG